MPMRLFTPEETLKTRDKNQKRFTVFLYLFESCCENAYENCSVVAVTLEKNVAIVVILASYRAFAFSSSLVRKEDMATKSCLLPEIKDRNRCMTMTHQSWKIIVVLPPRYPSYAVASE